jgi:hypothetical protein
LPRPRPRSASSHLGDGAACYASDLSG